jgi:hypothetical protein
MPRRKTVAGICLLCSLALSAVAAQSAGAVTKGTTEFTCVNQGGATHSFTDAHCKEKTGKGAFEHVSIAENAATELTVSSETTGGAIEPARLKTAIAGIELELVAAETSATGVVENRLASNEHYVSGEAITKYSGVTVTKPAEKGCEIYEDKGGEKGEKGVIRTNPLKATTQGQGDFGKLEPVAGEVIASFFIAGCPAPVEAINKTHTITGSIKCIPAGATVSCVHSEVTKQGTLQLNGAVKAGVELRTTYKSRANVAQPYTPISVTTVETP